MKDEDVEIAVRGAGIRSTWQAIGLWRQLDEVEPEAAAEQPIVPTVRDSTKRRGPSHRSAGGQSGPQDGPKEPVGSVPIVPRGTRKRKPKQVASIIIDPPGIPRGGTPVRWAPPCGSIGEGTEPGKVSNQGAYPAIDRSDSYARGVVGGIVPAPKRIKAACARYLAERADPAGMGIAWNVTELDAFVTRAQVMGMTLLPWQVHACAVLLARRRSDDGTPATRYALWSVARGAGKTGLVVALLEWLLSTGDDVELACVATQQEKANIIHGRIMKMHKGEDRWRFVGGGGSTTIGLIEHKKAALKAMPCTDNAMDGICPRLLIADEASRMDAAILRAMSSVTKTRTGQMLFITTPDRDQKVRELWPYWQACEIGLDQGTPLPEGWWALLWGMDAEDNPDSDLAVQHANPSAGVLISIRDIRSKIANALATADPRAREETWLQELATFTDDLAGALPLELLDRVSVEEDWDMLQGAAGVVAVDFSQGGFAFGSQCDLTSLCLAVWDGTKVHTRGYHWWAGADIAFDEKRTRQPLQKWVDDHALSLAGGPTIDLDLVEARLVEICRTYDIRAFVADPVGKASAWAAQMERKHGWKWHKAPQTIVWMGGGWAVWSDWIRAERIRCKPDPVLRACLASARLYVGLTGLAMPVKQKSTSNIDALTAQVMAARVLNDLQIMGGSMYETQPGF